MIKLPAKYWDFVMEYLPNYSHRDDVLQSDIYTRYLEGEDVDECDIDHFFANRSREEIENEYNENEWRLLAESIDAFCRAKYGNEDHNSPLRTCVNHHPNISDIPEIDNDTNSLYVYQFRNTLHSIAEDVNGFIHRALDNTNFIYEVTGAIDDEKMEHFNNLFKQVKRKGEICYDIATSDRMKFLKDAGCDIEYCSPARDLAKANLIKCGGLEMPTIVAGMLKKFYYENYTTRTNMEDCIKYLAEKDVAGYGFDDLEETYRGKIAQLLLCTFTGMRLGTKWNGRQEVNGGYIVVKNNGDVVAFHSTIADEFKDFLVAKMNMESPSHSRHCDMVIYKDGDKYLLKLGLQLRFALSR